MCLKLFGTLYILRHLQTNSYSILIEVTRSFIAGSRKFGERLVMLILLDSYKPNGGREKAHTLSQSGGLCPATFGFQCDLHKLKKKNQKILILNSFTRATVGC